MGRVVRACVWVWVCVCVCKGVFVFMMVLLCCVVMFCREIWHFCSLYEKLVFCCCNSFV